MSGAGVGPRRILFFEGAEDGTTGGSHQSMYDVVRHLDRKRFAPVAAFFEDNRFAAAIRELGIPVRVLQRERESERRAMESGLRWRKAAAVIAGVAQRARVLRSESVELLHLNNSPLNGLDDWLPAAIALGIPCVANAMGRPYEMPASGVRRRLASGVRRVRAISRYVADELRAGGWDERRIRHVPLSVDAQRFTARVNLPAREVRAQLGISESEIVIAMVGNIREWKGQRVVVEALARLPADAIARLRVLFIGATTAEDRAYLADVQARVEQARLGRCVSFLGSRTDVPNLVAAATRSCTLRSCPSRSGSSCSRAWSSARR
jgi:glycosyltransferase involved in cell wall biosynthesis